MRDKVREFSETGRKISGPPLPAHGKEPRVPAGHVYIEADYAGLELRILAHQLSYRSNK